MLGTGGIDTILPAGQLVLGSLDDAGQLGVNLLGLDAKCLIERFSYRPAKIPCLLAQPDHIFKVLQAAVELAPGLHCIAAPGLQLAGQGNKRADAPGQQGCTPVQALGGHGEILARLPEGAVHRLDGIGQFRRSIQPPGHAAPGQQAAGNLAGSFGQTVHGLLRLVQSAQIRCRANADAYVVIHRSINVSG